MRTANHLSATLSIMAGGTGEAFERARLALQSLGSRIAHLGPAGAGQVTKLANQRIVAQTIDVVAQGLRLVELAGLNPARVREALLGGFAESRILQVHGERMVRSDFVTGGRVDLQIKDLRLICQLAESVGLDSPMLRNSLAQWEKCVTTEGHGNLDHAGLILLYPESDSTAQRDSR
jgi:2-hydroxy-3-oxopropionate reductase